MFLQFIILIQTKLKWSEVVDVDYIFTPKMKIILTLIIFYNEFWHPFIILSLIFWLLAE